MQAVTQRGALPTAEQLSQVLDVGPARRRRRDRWLAAAGAATVLVASVFGVVQLRPQPVQWRTEPVRREDLHVIVDAVGTLEPREVVDIGSEQSGIVHEVFVEEDERVVVGQPLLALDPDVLSAQEREAYANVAALRAGLVQARAAERAALTERERAERLHGSRAIAPSELDAASTAAEQATAARVSAEAQLGAARARLGLAATHLDRSVLRSPIDGVVLSRQVEPGQAVVASFQSVTLFQVAADLTEMTLEIDIDEADVPRVEPGQSAAFSVPAWPDREFGALVTHVHLAPRTEGGVVTYTAELSSENLDGALRPGMTVTAHIRAEEHPDSLTVPLSALRFAPDPLPAELPPPGLGQVRLWRLSGDQPEPVLVSLGPTDGVRQAVTGPISSGDAVIVGKEGP
jgi:HlyD family secretion protein